MNFFLVIFKCSDVLTVLFQCLSSDGHLFFHRKRGINFNITVILHQKFLLVSRSHLRENRFDSAVQLFVQGEVPVIVPRSTVQNEGVIFYKHIVNEN